MGDHRRGKYLVKKTGVSFDVEDFSWLFKTYGKELTIADAVRCAILDAKAWRSHLYDAGKRQDATPLPTEQTPETT